MKNSILVLTLLHITLFASAQTASSNQLLKNASLYERIDFFDQENNSIVSLAPRFYKNQVTKKRVKPIKVNGKTYFIRIEKFGVQSVYTESGDHVADMPRNGSTIHLLKSNSKYTLRPKLKLGNLNILECKHSDGVLVSKTKWNDNKQLTYDNFGEGNPNLLLMALCAHQYQELLLGERGRLSAAQVWAL